MFCAKERSAILDNLNLLEYVRQNSSIDTAANNS